MEPSQGLFALIIVATLESIFASNIDQRLCKQTKSSMSGTSCSMTVIMGMWGFYLNSFLWHKQAYFFSEGPGKQIIAHMF